MKEFQLPFGITIAVDPAIPGSGTLAPQLGLAIPGDHADALESFLLAMAAAGIDLSDPKIAEALKTAVEAINNNE